MTLEQYWTILMKHWKLMVICFVVVGLGAFIGSKLMTPLYQSSALVQVAIRSNNNQADYNSLLASDQLVQTESALATSDAVLREVASHYPDLSVSRLSGEVSSTVKLNTQLFEIDVVDPSPVQAANLANDISTTLIKQQLQVIQQNNAQAQQQIQRDLDLTSQKIDSITSQIAALQAKGGNQGQLSLLQAQLSGLQQHYSQWQVALAQLELTQAQGGNFLQVAQPAQPATSPVRPNVMLNTAGGFLVGLLLGILLALLYERMDTRVRTAEEIAQLLGWPVLTTIWRSNSSSRGDMVNPTGQNVNVEAYRILRTNIGFSSIDKPLRSMLVTSPLPNDGKSITAANLAIFMAKAGKNTLLIDADLHRPTLHALFGLSSDQLGLSNAVLALSMPSIPNTPSNYQFIAQSSAVQMPGVPTSTGLSLDPFVHSVGIPNLWVMPSGPLPPNPSDLLESKVMQRFLAVVVSCGVEVVIFDSPPLLGLSDASIIASKVDGVLVVVDTTRATRGKLRQMKVILSQVGIHVLGCVANKVQRKHNDSTYSYYYQSEEQSDNEQTTKNGNLPPVPVTPMPVEPPSSFRGQIFH